MFQGTFLLLANNIHIAFLQAKNSAICLKIIFLLFIRFQILNMGITNRNKIHKFWDLCCLLKCPFVMNRCEWGVEEDFGGHIVTSMNF